MSTISFPIITKPHDDGCSVMVTKIKTEEALSAAINDLFAQGKEHALIEECIVGMELTVGVIGNDNPRALPPSQAVATDGILSIEEKFLPGAGENQTPAPLPTHALQLVQETIAHAYTALGCKGYARIDCFYQAAAQSPTGQERVVILEINTLPGMTPATCLFHQAAEVGIKTMDFISMIIELGFEEKQQRKATQTQPLIPQEPATTPLI
jgi:D-alanine-D-alanine ligase